MTRSLYLLSKRTLAQNHLYRLLNISMILEINAKDNISNSHGSRILSIFLTFSLSNFFFFLNCCGKCLSSALFIYIPSGFSWTARPQFPWKEPQSWPSLLPSCHHFPSLLSFKISILIIMHIHKLAVTRHQFVVVRLLFVVVVVSFGLACFVFLWMAAILFLRAHRTMTCLSYPLSHSQPWDTNKPQNDSGL